MITPGGSWNGTAGSGGTAPAENASAIGTGWTQQAIGAPDIASSFWLGVGEPDTHSGDYEITCVCEHGDQDWIDEVEFWLEGGTDTVTTQTTSARTGATGFATTIDASAIATDGDAQLYIYIRPVNGYERRLGPYLIHLNYNGTITRPVVTVKTSGGDYTTVAAALTGAASGAIVKVDPGTWMWDTDTANSSVARCITITPADGYDVDDVTISLTTRKLYFRPTRNRVEWRSLKFDTSKFAYIYPSAGATFDYTFNQCKLIDPNGTIGPPESYYSQLTGPYLFRSGATGQKFYVFDCEFNSINCCGATIEVNNTKTFGWDATFFNVAQDAHAIIGTTARQNGEHAARMHEDNVLTVASVSYDGGSDLTTLTVVPPSGTVLTISNAGANRDWQARFVTGSLADGETEYNIYSQSNVNGTLVLFGNVPAQVGDTYRTFGYGHVDHLQFSQGRNYENIIVQRYHAIGTNPQPWLLQAGEGYEVRDLGIQISVFDHQSDELQLAQWQYGLQHVVMRQITLIGCDSSLRNDQAGFAIEDCAVYDSIFHELKSQDTFPSSGITIDNNHFGEGTARGTNSSGPSAVTYDGSYRPTGDTMTHTTSSPKLLWDVNGVALANDGSDLIGAAAFAGSYASASILVGGGLKGLGLTGLVGV